SYTSCAFTRDGKQFALSEQGRVCFWDPDTGKLLRSFGSKTHPRLGPDARAFVRLEQRTIILGDPRTGKDTLSLPIDAVADGIENGIAFSADGKKIALVKRQKEVQIRDIATGKQMALFLLPDSARFTLDRRDYWTYHVNFSADGRTLLLGTPGGVHRWD